MRYFSATIAFIAGGWAGGGIADRHGTWAGLAVVACGVIVALAIIGHGSKK